MSDALNPARTLLVAADLKLEVGDGPGRATGRLTSGPDGLVLDVDRPAVLLSSVPGRGLARDLPFSMPPELPAGLSLQLRSHGRDLGVVRLTSEGKLRLRPSAAGWLTAARTAASYGKTRFAISVALAAGVGLLAATRLRRER